MIQFAFNFCIKSSQVWVILVGRAVEIYNRLPLHLSPLTLVRFGGKFSEVREVYGLMADYFITVNARMVETREKLRPPINCFWFPQCIVSSMDMYVGQVPVPTCPNSHKCQSKVKLLLLAHNCGMVLLATSVTSCMAPIKLSSTSWIPLQKDRLSNQQIQRTNSHFNSFTLSFTVIFVCCRKTV